MKKKRWKLAGIFLMAALTVPSLGGCKVGNTQIRLSSGQLRNHNAIVRINDHKYDIRYAKLYLCNYRNLYGKAYGTHPDRHYRNSLYGQQGTSGYRRLMACAMM